MKKLFSIKALNYICLFLFICALVGTVLLILNHYEVVSGLNFGAGAYYYTDIPNWEKRFFLSNTLFDYSSPLLFGSLFFSWGYFCYRLWLYIDKSTAKKEHLD